jgi:hypothetical protein
MNLCDITLVSGTHSDIRKTGKGCINNVISMLWLDSARKPGQRAKAIDDKPECVCPAVREYSIRLNDARWPSDADRTAALMPLVPLMMETADERRRQRLYYFADRAARVFAPLALRARGRRDLAARLRRLNPIVDEASARSAQAVCVAVRAAANAADAADAADAAAYAAAAADAAAVYAADAAADAAAYAADADAAADAARLRVLRAAACVLKRACLLGMPRMEQDDRLNRSHAIERELSLVR